MAILKTTTINGTLNNINITPPSGSAGTLTIGAGKTLTVDLSYEGNTSKEKYVFSADAEGNIRMNGEVIVTKGQGAESINNRTAKTINDKTQVVAQLVKALERNTGSDNSTTWSSADGKWYNEAFDGVTVLVSTTTINTGLWDPMERSTVFDPKLTPKKDGD